MTQGRLEALLIAAVERDLLIGLSDTDLVARFARGVWSKNVVV